MSFLTNQKIYSIKFFLLVVLLLTSTSCSIPNALKPSKVDKNKPVNAFERAQQNIKEGKGISLRNLTSGSTNYEFSTSNPLWRASLELIDFMPLTTVDYSGGIIITDWYTENNNKDNESLKITIRFLSNEVKSDSVKVIVHNKKCKPDSSCAIKEIKSKIAYELTNSILKKAANLEAIDKKKK